MKRDTITPQERALIDAHLATKGAIHCPIGAMATIPAYAFVSGGNGTGKNDRIVRMDGKNHWRDANEGHHAGKARARRLAAAS